MTLIAATNQCCLPDCVPTYAHLLPFNNNDSAPVACKYANMLLTTFPSPLVRWRHSSMSMSICNYCYYLLAVLSTHSCSTDEDGGRSAQMEKAISPLGAIIFCLSWRQTHTHSLSCPLVFLSRSLERIDILLIFGRLIVSSRWSPLLSARVSCSTVYLPLLIIPFTRDWVFM